MSRKKPSQNNLPLNSWKLDQIAKSTFFHQKLHEWHLVEIAQQIEAIRGDTLNWDGLGISEKAWNRVIHQGIKPIIVFAHPHVLQSVAGSTAYYRMWAMVSQKSMKHIGWPTDSFERGKAVPTDETANKLAQHLNWLISQLVETDETLDPREFDLWRGMAAGSQAQGSWQNNKGALAEVAIREIVRQRVGHKNLAASETEMAVNTIYLTDGRRVVFASEPDIAIYQDEVPLIAVEIKGGIDPAAVLERVGAALKSLRRTRQENPASVTILMLQAASLTSRALDDLGINTEIITHLFSIQAMLENETERERFFEILKL